MEIWKAPYIVFFFSSIVNDISSRSESFRNTSKQIFLECLLILRLWVKLRTLQERIMTYNYH